MRSRISACAKRLRHITGRPLLVVLTSPVNPFVPLQPTDVMEAMYGDPTVEFGNDGMTGYLGRNAKLHIDEPDGTSHGDHAHVGAVAVLRCTPAVDRSIAVWLRDHIRDYRSDVAAVADALRHAGMSVDLDEDVCCLDVFETISAAAVSVRTRFQRPARRSMGPRLRPARYGPLMRIGG